MNNDIYDKKAFCGIESLYLTRADDPFNRPCAGHDAAYEKKLYSRKRADQLFEKRLEVYSWLEDSSPALSLRTKIYKWIVRLFGGIFY